VHFRRCAQAAPGIEGNEINFRQLPTLAPNPLPTRLQRTRFTRMPTKPARTTKVDFRRLLEESGIRVTDQRLALLSELSRVRVPISHPELTERMSQSKLDRATIYRNLLGLTEAGLLVRTQLGDNVWRYELPSKNAKEHRKHPHFVCTACGNVKCLDENSVGLKDAQLRARVAEIQLRGLCPACARS